MDCENMVGPDQQQWRKSDKNYAPTLDNYGQSGFVRSDFFKMKCVCKTQMMPLPDHQNPVDMHTSIMCINILQNIKAVAPKLQEEIAGQTMYLYPDGRTDRDKLICTPTLRRGGIQIIQAIFMKSVDHEKFVKVTVHDIHLYRTETWITTYH